MDIYAYLFKDSDKKIIIEFKDTKFSIKKYKESNKIIYEIYNWGRLKINKDDYSSLVENLKKEYKEREYKRYLELIKIINKYNYINYCVFEDNLTFHGVDFITVNTLSGFENPYINNGFKVLQRNFPKAENLDILKSNAYYYDKFFKENVVTVIDLKLKEFIKLLKKIYGPDFNKKRYLRDIEELEKFDYTLKNFILEKANLEQKSCFTFFYESIGKVMDDLYLLPKKYVMFFN